MRDFLRIARALSDEARVRALLAVKDGELCLCQIIDLLQLAPSTVSKHMSLLLEAGLVERRKQGRWHFYRLADRASSTVAREALRWLVRSVEHDPRIVRDTRTLRAVRRKDLEELSACYRS